MNGSGSRAIAAVLRWATPSSTADAETRRFQQRRVALTARLMLIFFGTLTVLAATVTVLLARDRFWAMHLHPAKLGSYAMMGLWTAIWLGLRGRDRPAWQPQPDGRPQPHHGVAHQLGRVQVHGPEAVA